MHCCCLPDEQCTKEYMVCVCVFFCRSPCSLLPLVIATWSLAADCLFSIGTECKTFTYHPISLPLNSSPPELLFIYSKLLPSCHVHLHFRDLPWLSPISAHLISFKRIEYFLLLCELGNGSLVCFQPAGFFSVSLWFCSLWLSSLPFGFVVVLMQQLVLFSVCCQKADQLLHGRGVVGVWSLSDPLRPQRQVLLLLFPCLVVSSPAVCYCLAQSIW